MIFDDSTAAADLPREIVDAAQSGTVVVLSGAGMSAESGVPTFRDVQDGLWARYDPMTLATPEAFAERPALVWAWYLRRLQLVRQVQPNEGHRAVADLARRHPVEVFTQNVDDLHERAGSTRVGHLHGDLLGFRCADCGRAHEGDVEVPDEVAEEMAPPLCPHCGGNIRPGIVWFGETLPADVFSAAERAMRRASLVVVVGTSGVVHPVAGLPLVAVSAKVPCLEINPVETELSDWMRWCWRATSAKALPELVSAITTR